MEKRLLLDSQINWVEGKRIFEPDKISPNSKKERDQVRTEKFAVKNTHSNIQMRPMTKRLFEI